MLMKFGYCCSLQTNDFPLHFWKISTTKNTFMILINQAIFKNFSNCISNSNKIQEFNELISQFQARSENLKK